MDGKGRATDNVCIERFWRSAKCERIYLNEYQSIRDLCINRNNHQKPTFHPLGDFLNPALALLGQGLKKSPIGQKLDFASHSYLVAP
jgi:hypothetical protein